MILKISQFLFFGTFFVEYFWPFRYANLLLAICGGIIALCILLNEIKSEK